MEDVFYFTKAAISLKSLEQVARSLSYECGYFTAVYRQLRVFLPGDRWEVCEWDDYGSLEEAAFQRIVDYEPAAGFVITHRVTTTRELVPFLKAILKEYDGWMACDDDWDVVYTIETVDSIRCAGWPE